MTPEEIVAKVLDARNDLTVTEAEELIRCYGEARYQEGRRDADKTPNPWK